VKQATRNVGVLALVAAFVVGACTGQTGSPPPASSSDATSTPAANIRIGLVLPLSGANAPGGLDVLNGYKTGVEIVNNRYPDLKLPFAATSGISCLNGAKLEIVSADHQGDAQKGASETERLISEQKVQILADQYFSGVTAASQPIAERAGIPFLTSNASSPTLHTKNLKWWFRSGPHDELYTQAMFDFLKDFQNKEQKTIKTIGLFYEDTLFGQGSSTTQKQLAPSYGMNIVADVAYKAQATSLSSEVLRLKAANPDVVLMSSFLADSILFYRTMKDLNYLPPMIIAQGGSPGDPAFLEASGKDAEGLLIRSAWGPELVQTNPTVAKAAEIYKGIAGRDMGSDAPLAIQGLLVIADALQRACSTDPEKIRAALAATDLPPTQLMMPWSGVKFDATTHQNTMVRVVIRQLANSAYRTVWPFDIAPTGPTYPLKPWSAR
jgi:branched-chain amino acid transport system substrate-binding protein